MAKTGCVLLGCACFMLAASVIVAMMAIVFHPSKSETAQLIAELRPKIHCTMCSAGLEDDKSKCEKCPSSAEKIVAFNNCELTEGRKKYLKKVVEETMNDGTTERHIKTLRQATMTDNTKASVIEKISHLNLDVPRPSAHWYLHNRSARPQYGTEGTGMRNVSQWIWRNRNGTENGIVHETPHMKITVPGWYHVYFQLDIRSDVSDRYKAIVLAASGKRKREAKHLLIREEMSSCRHKTRVSRRSAPPQKSKHPDDAHSCVVLKGWGTFQLFEYDLLRIEVDMPRKALIDTRMGRSFFGALYLRHSSAK